MNHARRTVLTGAAAALAAAASGAQAQTQSSAKAKPKKHVRRIATEEGFGVREIEAAGAKLPKVSDGGEGKPGRAPLKHSDGMYDFDVRLAEMDAGGIDMQVLLLRSPGVQIFEAAQATELAKLSNDVAAAAVRAHPTRFAALAAVAPQDPASAALELDRAVRTLGAKGGLINSHTNNEYLDDRKFWPILEAAQALDVPIYIHPREPAAGALQYYQQYDMTGAMWGFAAETGLHAMRMILSGVFDQFPKLRIVLGHAGENIPFTLERIDTRYRAYFARGGARLKRLPSEYFKDNFVVTTSGINWAPTVHFCQEVLGPDKVLFAVDWPSEPNLANVELAEAIPMSAKDHALFFHGNAERVFKIAPV